MENSFTFDDIPLNLILSPIAQKSMQNIQKETGDKFEIFFKNSIQLYSLDNAFLSMDSRKKKFFAKGGKMKRQNQEENSKNQEKTENLEGNYVFPFEDQISNGKKNITCQLKNNGDETYDAECSTEGAFLSNINLAIGNGVEENIKDKYLMFNLTNDTVYFPENFFSKQLYHKESSKGLSGGAIVGIIIVLIAALIIVLILVLMIRKKGQINTNNESSANALNEANAI